MDYKEKRKLMLEAREAKEMPDMHSASTIFIKSRKLKNLSENTIASYKQSLTMFHEFLDENGI
ncbi:hypothetical protein [Paenibacillus sp. NPDC101420]|uniref:hypothetical protein n=1 Tax=Paenibacillus sp. NPDC101420 TaxID=3390602 RepID=UPI003D093718